MTNGRPPEIQPASLLAAKAGTPYRQELGAAGEIAGPFRWGITHGGSLPPGLSIDSQKGVIGGIPTKAGTYVFTVVVEAASGAIATREFTVAVE